jgi:hypothetical protein
MQTRLEPIQKPTWTRAQIDHWPIATSGLSARVVHCLEHAGVKTIGELRTWSDERLLALRSFGTSSLRNVHWFLNWTKRLENDDVAMPNFRALLREFLNRQEVFVIELRYGLADPLFRPQMKRRTLQEIADMRGQVTRERVRQVEEAAIATLRSKLCRAVAESQEIHWTEMIQARGCVVGSGELAEWAGDPLLGGYQPWGTLLLLSESLTRIHLRHDYFTTLAPELLNQVEKQVLQLLREARYPVPFDKILAAVSGGLRVLDEQQARFVSVVLDHHPEISGTIDRRYFVPAIGAPLIIADILRSRAEPLHFHELTRLYNDRMQPHSHKGTGYILRVLNLMPDAQRVSRAVYQVKAAGR